MLEKTIPVRLDMNEDTYSKLHEMAMDYYIDTGKEINISQVIEGSILYCYEKFFMEKI